MRYSAMQQRRRRQSSPTSAPVQLFAEQAQREKTASRTPGNRTHVASGTWSFAQIPVTHAQHAISASSEHTAEPVQRRVNPVDRSLAPAPQQSMSHENLTGLPDRVKTGVENLSGFSLDGVRVHYNSPKPAQVNALAYTQGTEIHVGPGQEKHVGHEAWHVVQQKQGRVRPTMQMKGIGINNDRGLEQEADLMGAKVLSASQASFANRGTMAASLHTYTIQRAEDPEPAQDVRVVDDPKRMGKEVELPSVTLSVPDRELKDGETLAETVAKELDLPVIKLEVEGTDRSESSIEIIFGPLPFREYEESKFKDAAAILQEKLRSPAKTLNESIEQYNTNTKVRNRYKLRLTAPDQTVKIKKRQGSGSNTQTNVAIPYEMLGEESKANNHPITELFEGVHPSKVNTYSAARDVSNKLKDIELTKNLISLFTHILYQVGVLVVQQIAIKEMTDEAAKYHYHVLIKASPEDAIFSILTDGEVERLRNWLDDTPEHRIKDISVPFVSALRKRNVSLQQQQEKLLNEYIARFLERIFEACNYRLNEGKQQLGRVVGKYGQISTTKGNQEITHSMSRASSRIPIMESKEDSKGYVVIEQRSGKHKLNQDVSTSLSYYK